DWPVLVTRSEGARGVLKNLQIMSAANVEERVDISRQAHLVNNHDRPGAWVDAPLDVGGIKVVGSRVYLGKYGGRARISDGVCGGDEAERRHDHFIARPDAENE